MLRIIPPARLATATDEDTRRIKKNGVPAAMIAGGNQVVSREKLSRQVLRDGPQSCSDRGWGRGAG